MRAAFFITVGGPKAHPDRSEPAPRQASAHSHDWPPQGGPHQAAFGWSSGPSAVTPSDHAYASRSPSSSAATDKDHSLPQQARRRLGEIGQDDVRAGARNA